MLVRNPVPRLTAACLLSLAALAASAQTPDAPQCRVSRLPVCVKHVVQDEAGIVTSPAHLRPGSLVWLVPFGLATGIAVHYDTTAIRDLGVDPSRENRFEKISNYGGLYLPFGAAAVGYAAGTFRHNDVLTETAVLSAEAMADAGILNEGLKYAIDREGPQLDNARGRVWPNGISGWPNSPSMPSEHAMNVWAFAHVVAGQYNGLATKAIVYGLATTVSASRVIARQHFPSDVVVGSTLGWLVGGYVLHHRSLEHGTRLDVSEVQTPMGRGLQLNVNLARAR